jgi:hypothetical protein
MSKGTTHPITPPKKSANNDPENGPKHLISTNYRSTDKRRTAKQLINNHLAVLAVIPTGFKI